MSPEDRLLILEQDWLARIEALKAHERFLNQCLERLPEPVISFDAEGHLRIDLRKVIAPRVGDEVTFVVDGKSVRIRFAESWVTLDYANWNPRELTDPDDLPFE